MIEANYLAGAPAARYLPPIIIPFPPPSFDDQFVNTAEEDYTLRPGTVLRGDAPDGSDIGADYPTLRERVQFVRTGDGPVSADLHAALLSPTTKKWTSPSGATNYWSAAVIVAAHGADHRPIAGATITVAWTGAVTKTSSCITAATGQCTLQSGTLSYLRSSVTLTVTNVSDPLSPYSATANHTPSGPGSAVTMIRP